MPPSPTSFADALVITGPTGSGKSAIALELAGQLNAEIVAMDSMTLYRGMDIGTAKPSAAERARVPHHLIDVLDPWESGSVAWWLDAATVVCKQIRSRGKRPLFVGGTPFYLKALRHGLFDAPAVDPAIRTRLEMEVNTLGKGQLHARLTMVDPKTAKRLHINDVRRVVRALEVYESTGRPISELQQSWDTPAFANANQPVPTEPTIPCVVVLWPREEMNQRIERRVDAMLAAGWLEEVRHLRTHARPLSPEASRALGYSELGLFLDGKTTWAETVERIKIHTRQFAKRQLTWFRHLSNCRSVDASSAIVTEMVLLGLKNNDD